jgi:hypothetical protein
MLMILIALSRQHTQIILDPKSRSLCRHLQLITIRT